MIAVSVGSQVDVEGELQLTLTSVRRSSSSTKIPNSKMVRFYACQRHHGTNAQVLGCSNIHLWESSQDRLHKENNKKLQGAAANTAAWATNVDNKKGEIVISVLTSSEDLSSLNPLANGLVRRYATAGVEPPVVMYMD